MTSLQALTVVDVCCGFKWVTQQGANLLLHHAELHYNLPLRHCVTNATNYTCRFVASFLKHSLLMPADLAWIRPSVL